MPEIVNGELVCDLSESDQMFELAEAVRAALVQLGGFEMEDRINAIQDTPDGKVVTMHDGTKVIATPNPAAPYHYDVKLAA